MKHIPRVVEQIDRMQPAPELEKDAPNPAEKTRPFEAQVFAIAHAPSGVPQHPVERQASQGMARECHRDAPPCVGAEPLA